MLAKNIDNYELLRTIGRGGMGIVYEARHRDLKRIVALKTITASQECCPEHILRFRREARALASLRHTNIVKVFDFGYFEGNPYLAMEYVKAQNLEEKMLRRGEPFESSDVIRYGIQLSEALAYIHRCGLIHRDIKPANVLLDSSGKLFLTDFGLVRKRGQRPLTVDGQPLGTPRYIAPEVACGEKATRQSDIYQLGLILYELVTGCEPYGGSEVDVLLRNVVFSKLKSPSELGIDLPRGLNELIMCALDKDPKKRFDCAEEISLRLRSLQKRERVEVPVEAKVEGKGLVKRLSIAFLFLFLTLSLCVSFPLFQGVRTHNETNKIVSRVPRKRSMERKESFVVTKSAKDLPKGFARLLIQAPSQGSHRNRQFSTHLKHWQEDGNGRAQLFLLLEQPFIGQELDVTINNSLSCALSYVTGEGNFLSVEFPAKLLRRGKNEVEVSLNDCDQTMVKGMWLYGL